MIELFTIDPRTVGAADLARTEPWLDDAERVRAAGLRHAVTRHVFLTTRALVRKVLGSRIGVSPGDVPLAIDPAGRPFVVGEPEIVFSISHGPSLVLCSLGARPHGIDAEPIERGAALLSMEDTVFSEEERRLLSNVEDRRRDAVHLWTLKESYLKARGLGLRVDPRVASFGLRPVALTLGAPLTDDVARWQFETCAIGEHLASVTMERGDTPLLPALLVAL